MKLDKEFHIDFKNLVGFGSATDERKTRSFYLKIDQIRIFSNFFWPWETVTVMLNTGSILEYQKGIVSNVLAFQLCHVCWTLIRFKIVFVAAQRLSRPSMTIFEDFLGFLMNSAESRQSQIKHFNIGRCLQSHWRYMARFSEIKEKITTSSRLNLFMSWKCLTLYHVYINPNIPRKSIFALEKSLMVWLVYNKISNTDDSHL